MFSSTLTSRVAIFLVLAFSLPVLAQITVNIPYVNPSYFYHFQ
jgi:hypothetical protein